MLIIFAVRIISSLNFQGLCVNKNVNSTIKPKVLDTILSFKFVTKYTCAARREKNNKAHTIIKKERKKKKEERKGFSPPLIIRHTIRKVKDFFLEKGFGSHNVKELSLNYLQ